MSYHPYIGNLQGIIAVLGKCISTILSKEIRRVSGTELFFSLNSVGIKIVLKNAPIVLELTVSLSYNKINCEVTKWCLVRYCGIPEGQYSFFHETNQGGQTYEFWLF